MITIVKKKNQVKPDQQGKDYYYKHLMKMIEMDDCELTEFAAMKRYGEPDLRSRVKYLNKHKGYNIQRLSRKVIIKGRKRLFYWYEQVEEKEKAA